MTNFTDAIHAIHHDAVICYPTEGVWGLGCHPQSASAFKQLLAIKQRAATKGVILLAGELAQLSPYIVINDDIVQLFAEHQNTFTTFVVPKAPHCPDYLSGQFDRLAVRVTHYAPLRELCLQAQTALVSTSANLSGQSPIDDIDAAKQTFTDNVAAYVDMPLGGENKPSQIMAWDNGKLTLIRE